MCGNLNLSNYVNCHFVAKHFLCKPWSNFYSVNVFTDYIINYKQRHVCSHHGSDDHSFIHEHHRKSSLMRKTLHYLHY